MVDEKKESGMDPADDTTSQSSSDPSHIEKDEGKMVSEALREEMAAHAMTLDVAYQSLEMVRKVNLQVEFEKEVDENVCVPCLRAEHSTNVVRSKFGKWMSKKGASPCLTCGSPVCKVHRSSDFGKQNIAICSDCAHLFSENYIVHHIMEEADSEEKKKKINNMLEVYDRALLILLYSTQFIDDVAVSLQGNTSRHNIVGLGSSATGVVSGSLGVAAACTILTPVGPPLLLASILFGGGATAATAGSEAVNYRSEPNRMADRILTLHSIITTIAHLPKILEEEEDEKDAETIKEAHDVNLNDDSSKRLHFMRTSMNALKPLTAGALSAVSIVTEAREMKSTVEKIRAGNPCDKADRLVKIKGEVNMLPPTEVLSKDLQRIVSRQRTPTKAKLEEKSETNLVTVTECDTVATECS